MGTIHYDIELEIYEGEGCDMHDVGETFRYPDDIGHVCPWLLDSVNSMVRVLQFGGTLPWKYAGTPYEKTIETEITEFVRCPDPTSAGVVVKITRKPRNTPKLVGWA
jgi:uncharacterized repeat protein (TIGR04076 family)